MVEAQERENKRRRRRQKKIKKKKEDVKKITSCKTKDGSKTRIL